jgi:hypothetical protein
MPRQNSVFQNSVDRPTTGPDAGVPPQPVGDLGVRGVRPALPAGVGGDGVHERLGEQEVVRRVLGRAGDRRRPLHHLGVADRPLPRLLAPHRPADDERQPLDAEPVDQQLVLARTSSPIRTRGKPAMAISPSAVCGDVDRPLPIWLTTTMHHFVGSSARPSPM